MGGTLMAGLETGLMPICGPGVMVIGVSQDGHMVVDFGADQEAHGVKTGDHGVRAEHGISLVVDQSVGHGVSLVVNHQVVVRGVDGQVMAMDMGMDSANKKTAAYPNYVSILIKTVFLY